MSVATDVCSSTYISIFEGLLLITHKYSSPEHFNLRVKDLNPASSLVENIVFGLVWDFYLTRVVTRNNIITNSHRTHSTGD